MRLLRLPDVLARVPVDQATIYRWIKAGEFPAPVKLGKASAWCDEEVDAFVAKPVAPPEPPKPAEPVRPAETALATDSEIAKAAAPFSVCGVYFLLLQGRVVYVGQSISVFRRLGEHVPGKVFDAFHFIPCAREDLSKIERAYIRALRPSLNFSHPGRVLRANFGA